MPADSYLVAIPLVMTNKITKSLMSRIERADLEKASEGVDPTVRFSSRFQARVLRVTQVNICAYEKSRQKLAPYIPGRTLHNSFRLPIDFRFSYKHRTFHRANGLLCSHCAG